MEKLSPDQTDSRPLLTGNPAAVGRRRFMRYLGTTAAAGVALSACQNEIFVPTTSARAGFTTIDLGDIGKDDVGILNYAYVLEQLEAAFYTQVVLTPYAGITAAERQILSDIRDHEIIHREFFKAALGAAAIPKLTPDFSMIDFSNRTAVLTAARFFENIGVSAYNGAGQFIKSADYVTLAGKIVSVEARHAAIIATLLEPQGQAFAGDEVIYLRNGLEEIRVPSEVLALVAPYVKETLNGKNIRRFA
jgi:hypothetical protein